jgi:hypothetical protein
MEKHQHNISFEESYWDDALAVLKREERKQGLRRLGLFLSLGALALLGAVLLVMAMLPSAKNMAKISNTPWRSNAAFAIKNETSNTQTPQQKSIEDKESTLPEQLIFNPENEGKTLETQAARKLERATLNTAAQKEKKTAIQLTSEPTSPELIVPSESLTHGKRKPGVDEPRSGSFLENTNVATLTNTSFEPKYVPMQSMGLKGLKQPYRHGLNYQLQQRNQREEAFRKWSLQPQQWMFYVGNAFTKDYAAREGFLAFNPQAGLAFEQHLAPNMYLRFALGVQQFSNVYAAEEYKEIQATFGHQYRSTEIATSRLYVLDAPVNLVYDFKLRHAAIVGVGFEYIGLTKNIIKTEMVDAFDREVLSSEDEFGYLSGYSPFFWNAQIGYRYRFNRRTSFDLILTSGFAKIHESLDEGNTRINARLNFNLR